MFFDTVVVFPDCWTDRVDVLARVQTRLSSTKVTEDLEGVSGAALIGVDPVLSCRGDREKRWENVKVWLWLLKMFIHHRPGTDISARISCQVCFGFCGLFPLPSLRSGWLRFRSWQVRAGLSWVPRGKRIVSISWRRELREPKISSMPSLPIRNSVPAVSDAGMSGSNSGASWLASMERLDLGLLWMGSGWMTSPGGPWEASLHH